MLFSQSSNTFSRVHRSNMAFARQFVLCLFNKVCKNGGSSSRKYLSKYSIASHLIKQSGVGFRSSFFQCRHLGIVDR